MRRGSTSTPSTTHRADPGQVVEADVVERHVGRVDAEPPGEQPLEADRDVAQPDGAVTVVEQGPGDDPDGIGEVDDPGVRCRPPRHRAGEVERHGDGAHRLGQAARTGRLLPHAAALEGERLVLGPRRWPPTRNCRSTADAPSMACVAIRGRDEPRGGAGVPQDPLGERPHDGEPLGIGIEQHELVDGQLAGQPAEAVDELGRVGRATPDDRELHAATLPRQARQAPVDQSAHTTRTGWNSSRTARARSVSRPKASVCVTQLGDVAREHEDEERRDDPADRRAAPSRQQQRGRQRELDHPRHVDDRLGLGQPGGHLRGERLRAREVAHARRWPARPPAPTAQRCGRAMPPARASASVHAPSIPCRPRDPPPHPDARSIVVG